MHKSGQHRCRGWLLLFGLLMLTGLFFAAKPQCVYAARTITIVIDPGHGGVSEENDDSHSGCRYHGLEEKNVNLITAKAMYDELCKYGNVDVYLTRDRDVELSLQQRVEYAQQVGADVLISVHYNASENHNFFGSEIFTSAYGQCYATGHSLAEKIMDEWVSEGSIPKDIKTRLGKKGDYYGLIRRATASDIPAIILEHGYLDNDRDYLRINNEMAWRRLGVLDATGVAKYYGLEKDTFKEEIGPEEGIEAPSDPVRPDDTEPEGVRLEIDNYSSNKGDVEFTLYAYDDESKLMYYGFEQGDVDKDTVFAELELWDGANGKQKGVYHLQPGYSGKLTAKVYNVYQLDSLSNTVELAANEEEPDDEEDNALKEEEARSDGEDTMFLDEISEEEEDWIIGGQLPAVDTSAVANAIDKNTESKVKNSYTMLLIAGLTGAVVITVSIVIGVSAAIERKRKNKKRSGSSKDVFDWAEEYDKD